MDVFDSSLMMRYRFARCPTPSGLIVDLTIASISVEQIQVLQNENDFGAGVTNVFEQLPTLKRVLNSYARGKIDHQKGLFQIICYECFVFLNDIFQIDPRIRCHSYNRLKASGSDAFNF
ncbi:hypothetical protein [Rubripirellula lacrimiformis]|uniref:hypothetical protein n=1 Tax=Rubripirellula lacrimiformis TaxID=1930273 RepID=UPI001C54D863|nr:hypothetical protein [Rubripirellula lacrimiformis]